VLSTSVIQGGKSAQETTAALGTVISATNQGILNKLRVTDKTLEVLWIAQSDFDQAVSLISATPEDIIVRLSSQGNTIYGEPVFGRIELYPNRLVYAAGATVLTEVFDTGTSDKQSEEAVLLFLQKVNVQAINQGILPDPIQGTVGAISGSQLFETINKVKRLGGKVELTALTKNNIHTAGPLQIEIQVKALDR
jgi:hypothetical protein